MKTAIFLNTFAKMKNYDMAHLAEFNIRNIAIVPQDQYEKFSLHYEKYFHEIHSSQLPENYSLEKISYDFAKEIVQKEIEISPSDVRIICLSEDNLLIAARLRDEFKIPGMGYEQTLTFRNKVLMKDILNKINVRTPRYQKFDYSKSRETQLYFNTLKEGLGLPFVLKPVDLLGGIGISIIQNYEEFKNFCKQNTSIHCYEIEEYISGTLFHCDSIRQNGKTIFSICCEYSRPNFEIQLGKSIFSIPLEKNNPLNGEITQFNETVLSALDLKNGIGHHEIFLNKNNELIFLEIAARSPGGLITPMYRRAFGLGLEDIDFKLQMDLPFTLSKSEELNVISGSFPMLSGTVKSLVSPKLKSEFEMKWYLKEGEEIFRSTSLREESATIMAWNTNYKALLEDYNLLRDFQNIVLQ